MPARANSGFSPEGRELKYVNSPRSPRGSVLADEGDLFAVQASRYSDPLPFADARAEMDFLNHRFLYFVDAGDARPSAAATLRGGALSFDDRHTGLPAVDRYEYLLTQ